MSIRLEQEVACFKGLIAVVRKRLGLFLEKNNLFKMQELSFSSKFRTPKSPKFLNSPKILSRHLIAPKIS